ncbi:PadR family transcriptional regulator [Cellulomonas sp. DKR-3]|uniref:PadR family transcriptional regulator n=1 Tax=Cellulomonas fulva TaxID=2835530 RepID=A0ABS5TUN7_9CELL|nr:PadR family transcriptional regulator [Cellulomonas fulva]MBT0992841.1 PadR family transcriptional regulator [Cellulomonas fulva]
MALSAVAVVLLSLLHEQPMHPYQLHQTLVLRHSTRLVRVNPGAVYHGVERLERDGFVEPVRTEREGRRPERTTYRITEAGRAAFAEQVAHLLGDPHTEYPVLPVGLSESTHLPVEVVLAELTRRRDRETADAATMRARYDELRADGLPRRYLLDLEHDLALLEARTAWLSALLEDLAAGRLGWGEGKPDEFVARRRAALAEGAPADPAP